MRAVAASLLIALLFGSVPAFSRDARPSCCKDERHCPMHQKHDGECRMSSCVADPIAVPAVKAVMAHALSVEPAVACRAFLPKAFESMASFEPSPAVPPPRA